MAKRGQLVIKALIILIVSAILIILYPSVGETFGKRDVYKKVVTAREIALIIDALYSYPYDVAVSYEKDLTGLIVEISGENIFVYDSRFSRNLDPTLAAYRFYPTGPNKIDAKLENAKNLKFEKIKNELIIKKE